MRITHVEIKKAASYEANAGQLVGSCELEGPTGSQRLVLPSFAISAIFKQIGSEIAETAKANARMVKPAVDEAINGPLLESSSQVDEIPF